MRYRVLFCCCSSTHHTHGSRKCLLVVGRKRRYLETSICACIVEKTFFIHGILLYMCSFVELFPYGESETFGWWCKYGRLLFSCWSSRILSWWRMVMPWAVSSIRCSIWWRINWKTNVMMLRMLLLLLQWPYMTRTVVWCRKHHRWAGLDWRRNTINRIFIPCWFGWWKKHVCLIIWWVFQWWWRKSIDGTA